MRLGCSAIYQLVQKCDVLFGDVLRPLVLHHAGHVSRCHPWLCLAGQAMVVGGKEGEGSLLGEPGNHRASNRGAIISGSASTKLVDQNKRMSRGVSEDGGGLLQLHIEGGLPANDVVPRTQPCEDPVHGS